MKSLMYAVVNPLKNNIHFIGSNHQVHKWAKDKSEYINRLLQDTAQKFDPRANSASTFVQECNELNARIDAYDEIAAFFGGNGHIKMHVGVPHTISPIFEVRYVEINV